MSLRFNPEISLTDVVLYLDAKNPGSYNNVGSIWYDCSGYNNHFTLQNNPTHDGTKLTFNGVNQYALANNNSVGNFGTGNFTIEYVINYGTHTGEQSYRTIIAKREGTTSLGSNAWPGFIHRIGSTNFWVQDNLSNGSINTTGVNNNPSNITSGSIQHVVQTINNNGTNTMVGKLYRNGTLLNTSTYVWGNYNGNGSVNNNQSILLLLSPAQSTYLQADLYTVRLYKRELTQSEITNNYNVYRNYYEF